MGSDANRMRRKWQGYSGSIHFKFCLRIKNMLFVQNPKNFKQFMFS
jgi:hypothetical protein